MLLGGERAPWQSAVLGPGFRFGKPQAVTLRSHPRGLPASTCSWGAPSSQCKVRCPCPGALLVPQGIPVLQAGTRDSVAALMPGQLSACVDRVRPAGRLFPSETQPGHPQQGPLLKVPSSDFSAFRLLFPMSSLMLLGIIPKTMRLQVLGFDLLDLSLHSRKMQVILTSSSRDKAHGTGN